MINPSDMDKFIQSKSAVNAEGGSHSPDSILEMLVFLLEDVLKEQPEIANVKRSESGEELVFNVRSLWPINGGEEITGPWTFKIRSKDIKML